MKRKVTIEFEVNPKEYYRSKNTAKGVVELVFGMLEGTVDFPPVEVKITCDDYTQTFNGDGI